jgi:hypothetical protein
MDSKEQEVTHLPKAKKSRRNSKKVLSESSTEVVMEVQHRAHRGEKIAPSIRKDHKFDPKQRMFAGRAL